MTKRKSTRNRWLRPLFQLAETTITTATPPGQEEEEEERERPAAGAPGLSARLSLSRPHVPRGPHDRGSDGARES